MPLTAALFVGCLTDQFYPRVGVATVKVLEHFGCRVTFPAAQTCCGQPLLHAGLAAEARAVARRFVEVFESAEYVVTPSPACASMVRERYPKLLADDAAYEAGMWHIAGRTYDVVEFLTTVVRADLTGLSLPVPPTAAYHPACPLRTLAVPDDTPRVLRQLGVAMQPLAAADVCCGFGGPFSAGYPSISRAMADAKARSLIAAAADLTVCNEAGCTMTIAAAGARAGHAGRIAHVVELLAESLGLDAERW
jgi:L-lactate dehydrogenase complex protein LldE